MELLDHGVDYRRINKDKGLLFRGAWNED